MERADVLRITELRDVTLGVKRQGADFMLSIEDKKHGEVLWLTLPQHVARDLREKLSGVEIASKLPFER